MKCYRNPMHVKNLKTKWAHLTRCQQRIESCDAQLFLFISILQSCCWHSQSVWGPGWRQLVAYTRTGQPRLKRYWADTKVTMCSRQVWAVHSDRNWEMCSLDLPFWRKPGTSSMFWARRIHSLRGICIPPSLCAPKAEKVKMFVSTMEFETFYHWSLQIIV